MAERGSGLSLLMEAAAEVEIGAAFRGEKLEGDEAVEFGVAGFVHDAHAAGAELFEDQVVVDGAVGHGDLSTRMAWSVTRRDLEVIV
jgi:hypothetical protein